MIKTTVRTSQAPRLCAQHMIAAVGCALSLLVVLSGCGGEDVSAQAIREAEIKLGTVSFGGSSAMPSIERRRSVYNDVLKTVGQVNKEQAGPGQLAASKLLEARAHAGLGEIQAANAAEDEGAFIGELTVAEAWLNRWTGQNATAERLEQYDPTSDLAELEKQIQAKGIEADQMDQQRAAQASVVAQLKGQAEGVQAQAKSVRERANTMRAEAKGVSAQVRSGLIEQAVQVSREADALDKQASLLLAQAGAEAPKVDALARQVQGLRTQQDLLRQSQKDVRTRAESGKQHASAARQDAKDVGTKLASILTALESKRTELETPTDSAAKSYQAAIRAAQEAGRSQSGKSGIVAAGGFQQSLADTLASKARGMHSYARLIGAVASSKPALPGGNWGEKAKAADSAAKAALDQTLEAYEAAKTSFSSGGASDKAKAVAESIERLLSSLKGGSATKSQPEGQPHGGSPVSAGDAGAAEQVRAALSSMLAAKSPEDALKFVKFKDESTKNAIEGMLTPIKALAELKDAAKSKFGKDLTELLAQSKSESIKANPMLSMVLTGISGALPGMEGSAGDVDGAKIDVKDDTATVSHAGQTMQFVNEAGTWKMLMGMNAQELAGLTTMKPMLDGLAGGVGEVVKKINTDGYADADAMLEDLAKQLMGAVGAPGSGKTGG